MSGLIRLGLAMTILTGMAAGVSAQATSPSSLALASLEDLLNTKITSAARREQSVEDTAAAVYVITQDDIRRSGLHLLPELFRLVPGMQVGQIGASEWAVSIRGFNTRHSNKVLVLVDGRSIYNHAYTGVFWSSQEMMLDDIERIEVIRGPGGAVWGADAVNGVINIITKSAHDTQGTLVGVGGGTFDAQRAAVRYGGRIGSAAYRVFSQYSHHEPARTGSTSGGDEWASTTTGGRLDWSSGISSLMLETSVIEADTNIRATDSPTGTIAQGFNTGADAWHYSVVGRWTRAATGGGVLQVQSFLNVNDGGPHDAADLTSEKVADLDVQYQRQFGPRHDVVVGGGYRYSTDHNVPSGATSVLPADSVGTLVNVFGQDTVALGDHVQVTIGSKFERDNISGWDVQPSARALWDVGPAGQHLWVATSRAVRLPAPYDRGLQIRIPLPPDPSSPPKTLLIFGKPDYATETMADVEAGYRVSLGSHATFDATVFRAAYASLITRHNLPAVFQPGPPPTLLIRQQFGNGQDAAARGVELSAHVRPSATLSLEGSYSYLHIVPTIAAGDIVNVSFLDNSPTHQWQVRASRSFGKRAEATGAVFHAGAIDVVNVAAYTRVDLGLHMNLTSALSLSATAQNLLQATHVEADQTQVRLALTEVPRSAGLHLTWRF